VGRLTTAGRERGEHRGLVRLGVLLQSFEPEHRGGVRVERPAELLGRDHCSWRRPTASSTMPALMRTPVSPGSRFSRVAVVSASRASPWTTRSPFSARYTLGHPKLPESPS